MRRSWLASPRGYRRRWLRTDLLAGLTIWSVLVPESFACAQLAGVPPETGLYAMIPALLCHGVFGGPERVPVGPISVTAALSAVIVAPHVGGGAGFVALSAALALVAGCAGLVAGLARLGFAASLIAPPVLRGFTLGLVATVLVGQLPKLLGLPPVSGSVWNRCAWIAGHLGDIGRSSALLGGLALLALRAGRRRLPALPIAFIVVIVAVTVSRLWLLDTRGVEVVDPIDRGLPLPAWPAGIGTADLLELLGPGIAVLIVGLAEGMRSMKGAVPQPNRAVDPNRELVGIGLANLGSGVLSGMVVGGNPPTAAVSVRTRTRLGILVAAALAVLTVLFLAGLYERLPSAVLAALAMAVMIELADPAAARRMYLMWRQRRGRVYERSAAPDCAAAVATSLAVLALGVLPGLLAGLVLSTLLLARRARHCRSVEMQLWPRPDGVLLAQLRTGVCFANAEIFGHTLLHACTPHTRAVELDVARCPVFDTTAAETLVELSAELAWHGVAVRVVDGAPAPS
ncbi:SulP family inorganic anion transporter [Nocardia seriolae]|uniref:Proton/sulfate cotransporter n=1 Tax=Nocardia seriolae TaxID=37332 RepID=A0ABC9YZQ6_9NOCA|nr:SulP family inorganic anion transporter [Nocardia seriolae]APA98076.1 Proton/sulfate cotransporter [Nocardia seriolae]OJF80042.1 hypothetical protein NS14008_13585 [Nocardia seriolae]QOW36018.1 SulP family inorganic anion transporter [Nocardia seriolae]QUN16486.1 SulP family inorganic anion transporter [Nocardia seriolae]WKY49962.1 SulP family inorganic anion transporter [Nocardia seriolae]